MSDLSAKSCYTCQYSGWCHIIGNVEDRYLGSGPCRVLISSDSLIELIIYEHCLVRARKGTFRNKINVFIHLAVRSTLVFVPGLLPAETGVATQDSVCCSPGEVGEARTEPVTVGDPGDAALRVTEVLVGWTLHVLTGGHHGHGGAV